MQSQSIENCLQAFKFKLTILNTYLHTKVQTCIIIRTYIVMCYKCVASWYAAIVKNFGGKTVLQNCVFETLAKILW